jgi:hypothetical protein
MSSGEGFGEASAPEELMAGHVFVVQSDITQLRWDAWLLPCDRRADPGEHWRRLVRLRDGPVPRPAGLASTAQAFPVPETPAPRATAVARGRWRLL